MSNTKIPERKVSVSVPTHFTDTDGKEIDGGTHEIELSTALRWQKEKRAAILDVTVKGADAETIEKITGDPAPPSAPAVTDAKK